MSSTGEERSADAVAEVERLRAALYAPDAPAEAADRYRAALARLTPGPGWDAAAVIEPAEPTAAPEADEAADAADAAPARPVPRRRIRTALVAGGLLLGAAVGAVLLVPRPAPEPPEITAAPLRLGPALWSAHGVKAASSPDLDGGHHPLLIRLRCRGVGQILLAVDGRIRSLGCVPGRTIEDDQYFEGPHDRFLVSLSLVGSPAWSASAHRVLSAPDG